MLHLDNIDGYKVMNLAWLYKIPDIKIPSRYNNSKPKADSYVFNVVWD